MSYYSSLASLFGSRRHTSSYCEYALLGERAISQFPCEREATKMSSSSSGGERRRSSVRKLLSPLVNSVGDRISLKRRRRREALSQLLETWIQAPIGGGPHGEQPDSLKDTLDVEESESGRRMRAARKEAANRIMKNTQLVEENTLRGNIELSDLEHLDCLPEFIYVVEGSLDVEGCIELIALGNDLRLITGNLNCLRCRSLAELPPFLQVEGWANFGRCRALKVIPDTVVIKGWTSLHGCSSLQSLDDLSEVGASLRLYQCLALRTLRHIHVSGDLDASACALEALEGVEVGGHLDLSQNHNLQVLPSGTLRAGFSRQGSDGDTPHPHEFTINLSNCDIRSLPPRSLNICDGGGLDLSGNAHLDSVNDLGCTVGKLNLANCFNLRHLDANVSVLWTINLTYCTQLRTLPPRLHLRGDLTLNFCASLLDLPDDLVVDGDLECTNCHALARVGTVQVGGRANFAHCNALHTLERGAHFGDSIILEQCVSLLRLPDDWTHIYGDLSLRFCSELVELPAQLQTVDGHVDLYGCTRLREVPENLVAVGGLTGFSSTGAQGTRLWSLEEAVVFWTQDPNGAFAKRKSISKRKSSRRLKEQECSRMAEAVRAEPAYERGIVIFLDKLRHTKDYELAPDVVHAQVQEAFRIVEEDPHSDTAQAILIRMNDAVNACHDKPAWALSQLYALSLVVRARGDSVQLRQIGLRIMRLGMVQNAALDLVQADRTLDDVSVMLDLECELKDSLDLPVLVKDFLFRKLSKVDPSVVKAICDQVLAVSDSQFEVWLEAWPEWQRQLRQEVAVQLKWEDLRAVEASKSDLDDAVNMVGDPVRQPVRLQGLGNDILDFDDVTEHWLSTGRALTVSQDVSPQIFPQILQRLVPAASP